MFIISESSIILGIFIRYFKHSHLFDTYIKPHANKEHSFIKIVLLIIAGIHKINKIIGALIYCCYAKRF